LLISILAVEPKDEAAEGFSVELCTAYMKVRSEYGVDGFSSPVWKLLSHVWKDDVFSYE
jgi:hypothetical protein